MPFSNDLTVRMSRRLEHPYADFLIEVTRPGRYVGREPGSVLKTLDENGLSICLAFPDVYEIGMSYLGFQILYHQLAEHPGIACERAFAPWFDMEEQLRARSLPLVSMETWRPLRDFDVLGFTMQYELSWTNVLNMMDLGGVPLRASERARADGPSPIVIAGGPLAANPEPLAPFVDAFLLGDGEELLPGILELLRELRAEGKTRAEQLEALEAFSPAVLVPGRHPVTTPAGFGGTGEVAVRQAPRRELARIRDLGDSPEPTRFPVPWIESTFDRVSVEIARGCIQGCRFCQAGYLYRPLREKPVARITKDVEDHLAVSGHEEVSLSSLSSADYSALPSLVAPLVEMGQERGFSLSFSSLRAYGLADEVLEPVASLGVPGLTLAPEAGTERMRARINKSVSDAQLVDAVERCFRLGWKRVKLYFMIGLPGERDEDVEAIVALSQRVYAAGRAVLGRRPEVVVSVSNFVPKPHTPFQWAGMEPAASLRRKQGILRDAARRTRLRLKLHGIIGSRLEAVMALGDVRVADCIEEAWRRGARFDGWSEKLRGDIWEQVLPGLTRPPSGGEEGEVAGTLVDELTAPRSPDAALPWSYVDPGLGVSFLKRELERSEREVLTEPCDVRYIDGGRTDGPCIACGLDCLQEAPAPGLEDASLGDESLAKRLMAPGVDSVDRGAGDALSGSEALTDAEPGEEIEATAEVGAPVAPPRRAGRGRRKESPARAGLQVTPGPAFLLRYGRIPPANLVGQNDAVRHVVRALRRAGFTFELSQGFSPRPRVSQSWALPFGYESLSEWLGMRFDPRAAPKDAEELLRRARAFEVTGLPLLSARQVPHKQYKLRDDVTTGWRFLVDFVDSAARGLAESAVEAGSIEGLVFAELSAGEREILAPIDETSMVCFLSRASGLRFRPERFMEGTRRIALIERRGEGGEAP